MSAFIVSKNHIDAMISSVRTEGIYLDDEQVKDRNRLGQELVNQNYRSVNERYDEKDEPPTYEFKMQYPLQPVQVIKLCDCYDYQACETNDYRETFASKIVESIRHKAIRNLPGYENAPWGID